MSRKDRGFTLAWISDDVTPESVVREPAKDTLAWHLNDDELYPNLVDENQNSHQSVLPVQRVITVVVDGFARQEGYR